MNNYLVTKKSFELIFSEEVIIEQDNSGLTIKNLNGKVILELEKIGNVYQLVKKEKVNYFSQELVFAYH